MEELAEVPLCVAGGITPTFPSFCMDGATHFVHTAIVGPIRVKPANKDIEKELEEYSGTKALVTVCGYQRSTGNCHHIEAYYVGLATDFSKILADGGMDIGG